SGCEMIAKVRRRAASVAGEVTDRSSHAVHDGTEPDAARPCCFYTVLLRSGSATGSTAAQKIKPVFISREAGLTGDGRPHVLDRLFEAIRYGEVAHLTTHRADQVMVMMIGEVMSEFVSCELID